MNGLHARGVAADRAVVRDLCRAPAKSDAWNRAAGSAWTTDDGVIDVLIAAQALEQKHRENGRPFLADCALQLERAVHARLDEIELLNYGWEPVDRIGRRR